MCACVFEKEKKGGVRWREFAVQGNGNKIGRTDEKKNQISMLSYRKFPKRSKKFRTVFPFLCCLFFRHDVLRPHF